MRIDREENMGRCLLVLAQLEDVGACEGMGVGNSDIARYAKLSRQTVNNIMDAAIDRGYATCKLVVWRENDGDGNTVYAKRYQVTSLWTDTYRHYWAARFRNRMFRHGK